MGHRRVTKRGRWLAAVLAAGDGAVLSHCCAAALWGVRKEVPREPEVTVARVCRVPGVRAHRLPLPPDETATVDGIPVTTVPRTLFDLAAVLPRRAVERAIDEAEYLRLWDPLSLPQLVERYPHRWGVATVRAILEGRDSAWTRSELEEGFRAFLVERGLPLPETNVSIELRPGRWIEPDCVWRAARLIVELDGGAAHRTISRFHGDRARDRALGMAGWTAWRVTERHLKRERDELEGDLRFRLGRARR